MSSPAVDQLQSLNVLFAAALDALRPRSVAVFGCAAGNGFEHIDSSVTERVTGIDINAAYLQVLRDRFASRLPNLELSEQDLALPEFSIPPVELAFAALVFEYVPIDQAVRNISNSLEPGGMLVAALQLPGTDCAPVTKTEFSSIEALTPLMTLVSPREFAHVCAANGLKLERDQTIPLKQGKALFVGYCRKLAEG